MENFYFLSFKRKLKKFSFYSAMSLLLLLGTGYWYLLEHAEHIFANFVHYETKGAVKLEIGKLKFNYKELRLLLVDTKLFSADTTAKSSFYRVNADTLVLELASLKPLIFGSELKVDSIIIKKPAIHIIKSRPADVSDTFTLPQQMGKAYESLNKALDRFSIKYCMVDSGNFRLTDRTLAGKPTIEVTDYYLMIDHMQKHRGAKAKFLFADNVKLYSSRQHITSLDGKHQLSYSRLRINAARKIIELDSCSIISQSSPNEFNKFHGYFDTLRFTNVNFSLLAAQNILQADSVFCMQPKVLINTTVKNDKVSKTKLKWFKSKDTLSNSIKSLLGNFRLKYIGVDNGSVELATKQGEKVSRYSLKKSDFTLEDVVVIDRPEFPLHVGLLDLGLMGYEAINPDSSYIIRFDSIRLRNNHLFLSRFSASPLSYMHNGSIRNLKTKALIIDDINWDAFFTSKKIVASSVAWIQPNIQLDAHQKDQGVNKNEGIFSFLQKLSPYSDINKLSIQDANIDIGLLQDRGIQLQGVYAEINVNDLLEARSVATLGNTFKDMSFKKAILRLNAGNIMLYDGYLRGDDKMVWVDKLDVERGEGATVFSCEQLAINGLQSFIQGKIKAASLHWNKAMLFPGVFKKSASHVGNKNQLDIAIDNITGGNTKAQFNSAEFKMDVALNSIGMKKFEWDGVHAPVFHQLAFTGDYFKLEKDSLSCSASSFEWKDNHPSFFNNIFFARSGKNDSISAHVNVLRFIPEMHLQQPIPFNMSRIVFQDPIIYLDIRRSLVQKKQQKPNLPAFQLDEIEMNNASIRINGITEGHHMKLDQARFDISAKRIHSKDGELMIDGIHFDLRNAGYEGPKWKVSMKKNGLISADIATFRLSVHEQYPGKKWQTYLRQLRINDIVCAKNYTVDNEAGINLNSLQINDLEWNDTSAKSLADWTGTQPFTIANLGFTFSTHQSIIQGINLNMDKEKNISIDSFRYAPLLPLFEYLSNCKYQKDYLSFSFASGKINGLNWVQLLKDRKIKLDSVTLDESRLHIFKDKRLPFLSGIEKPMPAVLISKIKIPLSIRQLKLNNAHILYEELNDKNNKTGSVTFSHLNTVVTNMHNQDASSTDSLRISSSGYLMDSAFIRLRYAEAYADSLNHFSLGIRMRPFALNRLNEVLEPLAGASIVSGKLDTIRLNALGNDSLAHGKMKMYYRGLKIKYSGMGDDSVRTFKSKLITFLANDFLLKRNNKKGYGVVYSIRDQERSFANYWLRIALSGVMSNSGIKSNKNMEKRYKKEVEKMQIPELPEIGL